MEAARPLADLDRALRLAHEPAAQVVEPLDGRGRGVAAAVDGARARDLGRQLGQPAGPRRDAPRQRLEGEDVAVAVDDEPRQVVALAEDDARGVPVVAEGPPERPGRVKTPPEEAVVDGLVVPRHEPAHDLGAGIVEAPAEDAAVRGCRP